MNNERKIYLAMCLTLAFISGVITSLIFHNIAYTKRLAEGQEKLSQELTVCVEQQKAELETISQTLMGMSEQQQQWYVLKIKDDEPETVEEAEVVIETGVEVALPNLPTNVKFMTDYRRYNIPGTPHNRLQAACYTDEYGLRRFGSDYVVGLGSYYSIDIGDRFKVVLDSGAEFTVILGDGKSDEFDTDPLHMYTPCVNYSGVEAANVLEFIADFDVLSRDVYRYGSVDCLEHLKGNIVSMQYLGRDTSQDWTTYF